MIDDPAGWRASVLLTPCRGVWLASDTYEQRDSAQGQGHVMTLNQPALTLLDFAAPRTGGELLDLRSGILLHGVAAGESFSAWSAVI